MKRFLRVWLTVMLLFAGVIAVPTLFGWLMIVAPWVAVSILFLGLSAGIAHAYVKSSNSDDYY